MGRDEMALSRPTGAPIREVTMAVRDVEADYLAAYLAEYEAFKAAGRTEQAEAVAAVLREQYGHEVKPAKKRVAPERADQKAPEAAVNPKPER